MDKRQRRDLLSDLPLCIIHSILALVNLKDAVKTSVLSKQWRYKWATLPNLVFDHKCMGDETDLNRFITQVLLLHKGPIHKFKLSVPFMDNSHDIDNWLVFLSRNDIKVLILIDVIFENSYWLHSSIYDCEHLTHLELQNCILRPPPLSFNGFLSLRCLSLTYVSLSLTTIERLFANFSLLEKLILQHVDFNTCQSSELKIHAPNLKIVSLLGNLNKIGSYAPLLAKFSTGPLHENRSSPCNFIKLLGGLTNLEEFSGGGSLVKYMGLDIEPHHHSLLFHRLRVINLEGVMSRLARQIWVVVCLITGAPNLQKLKISFHETEDDGDRPVFVEVGSRSFWDSKLAPNFRFEKLKLIEMSSFYGEINEMELAKFLLASSPVLETLSFKRYFGRIDSQESLKLAIKLLSYRRASTRAEIVFS